MENKTIIIIVIALFILAIIIPSPTMTNENRRKLCFEHRSKTHCQQLMLLELENYDK